MRKVLIIGAVAIAALAAGCAGDKEYIKAQAEAITAQSNARVEEARAKSEEARAVIAVAGKLDAGGAAAYVLGLAFKDRGGASSSPAVAQVQRPRDFLDYLQGFSSAVGALGNVAVPIITVRENGKTQRELYRTNIAIEQARQSGETGRVQSVAQIASEVAANTPQPSITLSGTGVIGAGTYTGPVTTTRTCNGGAGAAGGAGGAGGGTTTGAAGGQAGAGGSAQGGSC